MPLSINPKDQVRGGLIADINMRMQRPRFGYLTYKSGDSAIVLADKMQLEGGDEVESFWSVGSPDTVFLCDANGKEIEVDPDKTIPFAHGTLSVAESEYVESKSGSTGFTDSSNFAMLLREIEMSGFPNNKLTGSIAALDGLTAFWIRKAQPDRPGLKARDEREKSVLVPKTYYSKGFPKQASSTAASASTASSKTATKEKPAAKAADVSADLENETATGFAVQILDSIKTANGNAGKSFNKNQWSLAVMGTGPKVDGYKGLSNEDKAAVTRLLKFADFLQSQEITVGDGGDVTLPA